MGGKRRKEDRVVHKVVVARVSENILGTFIFVTFPLPAGRGVLKILSPGKQKQTCELMYLHFIVVKVNLIPTD